MEDIIPYIFIIGAVVISIIKQVREEAAKKANGKPAAPMAEPWPQVEWEEVGEPMPASGEPASVMNEPAPKPFIPRRENPTFRTTSDTIKMESSASPLVEAGEEASEFAIRNAEEARRAIIYSEILQRKYS